MTSDADLSIVIFDDEDAPTMINSLASACEGTGRLDIKFSICADLKPLNPAEFATVGAKSLDDNDLKAADLIIIDLKMPLRSVFNDSQAARDRTDGYGGLYTLRRAGACGCFPKVLVNSNWINSLADPNDAAKVRAYPQLLEALNGGAAVFQKTTGYKDLCAKVFAMLDLRKRGYSVDGEIREQLYMVARRALEKRSEPVLILGKSGTGKEQAAEHIHAVGQKLRLLYDPQASPMPMDVVHCGALTEDLARSELFGHVRGSFTGAGSHKIGRILRAIGATGDQEGPPSGDVTQVTAALTGFGEAIEQPHVLNPPETNPQWEHFLNTARKTAFDCAESIKKLAPKIRKMETFLQDQIDQVRTKSSSEAYYAWLKAKTEKLLVPDTQRGPLCFRVSTKASYGSVFLDEFGELPPQVQALLLRFLEYGEIQPLGYEGTISLMDEEKNLHVRFIGATNRKSVEEIVYLRATERDNEDLVRRDLVHRLAVWPIVLRDLSPDEVGAEDGSHEGVLIQLEKDRRPDLAKAIWDPDAIIELRGYVPRLSGQRRQLRTIAMRAMAYAIERQALGRSPKFSPDAQPHVTLEVLKAALGPVEIQPSGPATQQGTSDPVQALHVAICKMLRERYGWSTCAIGFQWESARMEFKSKKTDLCGAFLRSSLFELPGHSQWELQELESAWGSRGKSTGTIRAHLKSELKKACAKEFPELGITSTRFDEILTEIWTRAERVPISVIERGATAG